MDDKSLKHYNGKRVVQPLTRLSGLRATAIVHRLSAATDSVRGLAGVRAGALLLLRRLSIGPVETYAELM